MLVYCSIPMKRPSGKFCFITTSWHVCVYFYRNPFVVCSQFLWILSYFVLIVWSWVGSVTCAHFTCIPQTMYYWLLFLYKLYNYLDGSKRYTRIHLFATFHHVHVEWKRYLVVILYFSLPFHRLEKKNLIHPFSFAWHDTLFHDTLAFVKNTAWSVDDTTKTAHRVTPSPVALEMEKALGICLVHGLGWTSRTTASFLRRTRP